MSTRSTGEALADRDEYSLPGQLLEQGLAFTAESLARFLSARTVRECIEAWFGEIPSSKEDLVLQLNAAVAVIDELLNEQVNVILHHPRLQQLEASWRGLHYLIEHADITADIKIRVLSVTWRELAHDADRAIEFDQSQLFKKIYSSEFGTPGGEPFGLLLGDYEVTHQINPVHRVDDVSTLANVAQVSAAAFAPFVAGAHPHLFGLDSFAELQRPINISKTFDQLEYMKWRTFRSREDTRFVALTVPRVLMRRPYTTHLGRADGFCFKEKTTELGDYLWGTAVYAFGTVVLRSFAQSSWPADIRGVDTDVEGGGLVTNLVVDAFDTDDCDAAHKCSTDVRITDTMERELGELGLIALTHCRETDLYAFYSTPSLQRPKKYDMEIATANARISSMLQYMMCVSRFAHYIKVIGRERMGSFADAAEAEGLLRRWLDKYVTQATDPSAEVRARFPLREATVQVREIPGKPGSFGCVIHLRPHFQLDDLDASVKLVTELVAARVG